MIYNIWKIRAGEEANDNEITIEIQAPEKPFNPTESILLPCPFCGSKKLKHERETLFTGSAISNLNPIIIKCLKCGASVSGPGNNPDYVINIWNRRIK